MSQLLLIELDDATRAFLTRSLTNDGYHVTAHPTIQDAGPDITASLDLAVIDTTGFAGLDLIGRVRDDRHHMGILALAGSHSLDVIQALEAGADDAIARPFAYPELRARVASLQRRHARRNVHTYGPVTVDVHRRSVTVHGQLVAVTPREWEVLVPLIADPLRTVPKAELLRSIWGLNTRSSNTRLVDSHMSRLRRTLSEAGAGDFVHSVYGVGYRFAQLEAVAA